MALDAALGGAIDKVELRQIHVILNAYLKFDWRPDYGLLASMFIYLEAEVLDSVRGAGPHRGRKRHGRVDALQAYQALHSLAKLGLPRAADLVAEAQAERELGHFAEVEHSIMRKPEDICDR